MVKRTKKLETLSDLELRNQILEGNILAESCIFRRYQVKIREFLLANNKISDDDIDDITIISLQKILKKINTYDPGKDASFSTWAFTIAKNTYLDWVKKYGDERQEELYEDSATTSFTAENQLIEQEREEYIGLLLSQLSEIDQKILVMKG
ncbi:MAG: sigma-70 family RNA polymerase sigma factor, partial [Bacteroidales bacterium]|nr:sigma-70 family RNA polymerase sigma factor [Bacteroidales bacterium]